MHHVVLLGDSIFDNAAYVPGGEPVIEQLRSRLPRGSRASLLATDGAVVLSVLHQLENLPKDATHLVVSAGGNDALQHSDILGAAQFTSQGVFAELADIQRRFAQQSREMLQKVLAARKPTILCTIYDAIPGLEREAVTALSIFNDAIIRAGVAAGVPILDLRFVCTEPRDFSAVSPIEPSEIGGAKIVTSILRIIRQHDFARDACTIYR